MAFMAMVFAGAALIVLLAFVIAFLFFLTLAIILKVIGKKKDKKAMRIIGNILMVIGILCIIPVIVVVGYVGYEQTGTYIVYSDGTEERVSKSVAEEMMSYAEDGSDEAIEKLDKLLDKRPELLYWRDINCTSVLDVGIDNADVKVIKCVLEHGNVIDQPFRYRESSDTHDDLSVQRLNHVIVERRELTDNDVAILKILLENGATYKLDSEGPFYSNALGEAAFYLLFMDGELDDRDMEYLQVFVDNGCATDGKFDLDLTTGEAILGRAGKTLNDVKRDDNYYAMLNRMCEEDKLEYYCE